MARLESLDFNWTAGGEMQPKKRMSMPSAFLASALVYGSILGSSLLIPPRAQAASLPGWNRTCYAPNWMTGIEEPVPDYNVPDLGGYWGFTNPVAEGHWVIRFSLAQISGAMATRSVLQFLFLPRMRPRAFQHDR